MKHSVVERGRKTANPLPKSNPAMFHVKHSRDGSERLLAFGWPIGLVFHVKHFPGAEPGRAPEDLAKERPAPGMFHVKHPFEGVEAVRPNVEETRRRGVLRCFT